ncbi:MAG TPA: prohibitin family protein [Candidatus Acidoferrales bacterium]|nr:prohibitin family protein [Candidatus Acidoferrales bacterium]
MSFLLLLIILLLLIVGLVRSVSKSPFEGRPFKLSLRSGLPYFLGAVAIFIFYLSFVTVSAGNRGVVLRFDATTGRTLNPGLHLIIPFLETVQPISVQVQIEKLDTQASSHDLQVVHTQVTLAYYQDACCVGDIWSELNNDAVTRVIMPAIQEAVKAQTAKFDAEQLINQRATVREGIEQYVRQRLTSHHINVDAVSITDFNFSEEFNHAIEAKVTAAQNALKAENDLNRIKVEAQQKVEQAKAEAEALSLQKQQVTPELLQLRLIEMQQVALGKWDGHLPEFVMSGANGSPVPVMDVFGEALRGKK